jgi:hypothetical protein
MRKITREAIQALYNRRNFNSSNTRVEDGKLYLHGNLIAKIENGELWITNAGWTSSTTKERLNGLRNVSIKQKKGDWFLNGELWSGGWVRV